MMPTGQMMSAQPSSKPKFTRNTSASSLRTYPQSTPLSSLSPLVNPKTTPLSSPRGRTQNIIPGSSSRPHSPHSSRSSFQSLSPISTLSTSRTPSQTTAASHPPGGHQRDPVTPAVPRKVGNYTICDEVVGKGYYAEVRKAFNHKQKKYYAVKIFDLGRDSGALNDDLLAIAKHEVFTLRILRHQHVVRVYEHLREVGVSYVFMELVSGQDLVHLINASQGMSEEAMFPLFRKVVETVKYLHERGVYHHDLKPENIMVDSTGFVTIVDFGASQRTTAKEPMSSKIAGTPHYLPPECANEKEWRLDKLDIWSLGILLYVSLVGMHPFNGRSKEDVFAAVSQNQVDYPSHLSASVVDLLKKMNQYQPKDRPTLAEILDHPWMNQTAGNPIELPVPPFGLEDQAKLRTDSKESGYRSQEVETSARTTEEGGQGTSTPQAGAVSGVIMKKEYRVQQISRTRSLSRTNSDAAIAPSPLSRNHTISNTKQLMKRIERSAKSTSLRSSYLGSREKKVSSTQPPWLSSSKVFQASLPLRELPD